jgi:RNA polymerase sigma-70 factor (sigma-E family)
VVPGRREDEAREGFVAFVEARQRALLRSAFLVCGDHHLAQDLLQDALTKLALRWERVRDGQPEAYVRRILFRDMVSWHRRHRREQLGSESRDWPAADALARAEDRMVLERALNSLTRKQRAVLVLRYFDDRTAEQTADILGVTIGTVKSQTHAALGRLRDAAPELRELLVAGKDAS